MVLRKRERCNRVIHRTQELCIFRLHNLHILLEPQQLILELFVLLVLNLEVDDVRDALLEGSFKRSILLYERPIFGLQRGMSLGVLKTS